MNEKEKCTKFVKELEQNLRPKGDKVLIEDMKKYIGFMIMNITFKMRTVGQSYDAGFFRHCIFPRVGWFYFDGSTEIQDHDEDDHKHLKSRMNFPSGYAIGYFEK